MKKSLTILILTALAATSFAAKVSNVQLAWENGETVARIEVSGQVRFTHQTEIPKDGKPDRVIVDVLSATHELGAKVFENLPNCPITAIRTSQYSVKPEAVVRLVFDVKKTPVYQVESQGQFIVVHFIDKSAANFPTWSSAPKATATAKPAPTVAAAPKVESPKPTPPPVTVAQKNASAESDRQNSLATAPAKPATAAPVVTPVEKKPTTVAATPAAPATHNQPSSNPTSNATKSNPVTITTTPATAQKATSPTPTATTKPTVVATAPQAEAKPVEAKPVVAAPATPTAAPVTKSDVKPVEPKPTPSATPVVATTPVNKPVATTSSSAPTASPVVKTDAKPVEQKTSTTAASVTKTDGKPTDVKPSPVVASTPTTTAPRSEVKPVEPKPVSAAASSPTVSAPVNKPQTPTASTTTPAATTPQTPAASKPAPTVAASPAPAVAPSSIKPNPAPAATPTVPASKPTASSPMAEVKSEPVKPAPTAPAPATTAPMAKPATPATQTYTIDDEDIPNPEDLEPAQENPYIDHDSPAGSQLNDEDTPVDSNSTARFRRRPLSAAKIKGTMIAQFPQRLVIKYESNGARDPFATLIDDSRTFNSPTHQGVPNVDGLRLVGVIVARQGGNRALFIDKAGYSYMLKSGDKVRNGYVLRIESDRAYFQIFEYGWSRTVALKIDES